MFFSVQLLVGRDAKFGLVWRAATSGSARKLPRKSIVHLSVTNTCHEILKNVPVAKSREADLSCKFSLYLLGQLIYGTVLIFDRQTAILEVDVRNAYEACKRLPMEELLTRQESPTAVALKKHKRRSKLIIQEQDPRIDIDEPPESRYVHQARRSEITMLDSEPIMWQRPDVFDDHEHQLPIDFSKEHFIDWNEQRSSGSSTSKEHVEKIEQHFQKRAVEPLLLGEELPPFPPPEAFLNMDRETFMAGVSTVDVVNRDHSPQDLQVPAENVDDAVHTMKRPRLDEDVETVPQDPHSVPPPETREVSVVELQQEPLHPSLELEPLVEEEQAQRLLRRRKHFQAKDSESLTISYQTMKELQSDYSSLVRPIEELRVDVADWKYPSLHELCLPYPAYAGNRFPKECVELYRSRICDTLTYNQAIAEDFFGVVDRGPLSMLWHYESGSTHSSEDFAAASTAFLRNTPERFRSKYERDGIVPKVEKRRRSPGKFSLRLTPEWYKHDEGQREEALARGDGPLLEAEQMQPSNDFVLPEETRLRESRGSYVEEARRRTRELSDFGLGIDRRSPSMQLFEPFRPADVSQQSIRSSGRLNILSESLREKVQSEECRALVNALSNTSEYVTLSSVIPRTTTSKKRAAAVFSSLLWLLRQSVVEVQQNEPFGEIWVRAYVMSRSTDQEAEMPSPQRTLEIV